MDGQTCRTCSAENTPGARFCSACGAAMAVPKQGDGLVGRTLAGKFRVEKLLGNGAMGRVYQATHLALERGVAIKVMHDHLARSGEFATRFVREARAASRLDHPNSIRVLDFGRTELGEGGLLYLVMELFIGKDLYEVLRDEGLLPLPRAAKIVAQVLLALEDAHAISLVHRDLKPENVLIGARPDGTDIAKICDFGIAKLAEQEGPKLSQVGQMIGTPLYMSPEAACGRETDARSDLYSVGVILYEAMTGSRPFDAAQPLEVARLHVEQVPDLPSRRAPERAITQPLEQVIMRALSKRPDERFQDARSFREALEAALQRGAPAGTDATTPCGACGAPVPIASRFCASCGAPRTTSAARMSAQSVGRAVGLRAQTPAPDETFSPLAGLLPDRLVADLRRAQSEAKAERKTLVAVSIDLVGADDEGDAEELAARIGDRSALVTRVLSRYQVVFQGAGGSRVAVVFGLDSSTSDAASVDAFVSSAVEACITIRRESGNARWFRAGIASGVFMVTAATSANAPATIIGAATQQCARFADAARPGEVLLDASIRGKVGEGFSTIAARGGLFLVREDYSFAGAAAALRPAVGREAEIDELVMAGRSAIEGQGRVVAIRGEAGVGKTAVVREAIARMRDMPIRWYRVACRPTGQSALGALRDLILTYTGVGRGAAADVVRTTLGGDRGSLAGLGLEAADQQQIVSLLLSSTVATTSRSRSSAGTFSGNVPPEVAQREGGAAIRSFLGAALRKGGVGFVIEDLQWIDSQSAALLAQLASAVGKHGAILVLTARAGIWSDWNAPHFQRIHLGPLPVAATTKILGALLPDGEVPVAVAQPILLRAGGNPLFLESIVEALRASGGLRLERGRYELAADAKLVTEGLRGLVEARLQALDLDAQRCLLLTSVAGSEVDVTDLESLAGLEVACDLAVDTLLAKGLLEERGRSEGGGRRVGFANDGVREVLYDLIPSGERRALHTSLAERWEAMRAATRESPVSLEELARHWELAGEVAPAAARLEEAAQQLAERGEFKQATNLLKRAFSHVKALDSTSAVRGGNRARRCTGANR